MKDKIIFFIVILFIFFIPARSYPAGVGMDFKVPAPGSSKLIEKNDHLPVAAKGTSEVYISKLNQNTIENDYKGFFRAQGFKYRKDKEIRDNLRRRLRFEKDGLAVDIALANSGKGTFVWVMKYIIADEVMDIKSIADIRKTPVEIPLYNNQEKGSSIMPAELSTQDELKYAKDYSDFEIPPPPASELINTSPAEPLTGGKGEIFTYYSQKSSKAVESFYFSVMKKNGFRPRADKVIRIASIKRIRFEAKDLAVEMFLSARDKGCSVTIVKYPGTGAVFEAEKNPFTKVKLPEKDSAAGIDLKDIPRPEGSTRLSGKLKGNKASLSYLVPMGVLEAKDFYVRSMSNSGWRLVSQVDIGKVSENYAKKNNKPKGLIPQARIAERLNLQEILRSSYVLDFASHEAAAKVMFYPNFVKQGEGSMVDIIYTKN